MADGREYVKNSEEYGTVNISEEVIASIAALAASDVPGIHGLVPGFGVDISELLGKKNLAKGVKISVSGNYVTADIGVIIRYGEKIPDVAVKAQTAVTEAIQSMAGLEVAAVNINVTGIVFEKKAEPESCTPSEETAGTEEPPCACQGCSEEQEENTPEGM
ncbi:Asp23/Gls24 family envelope stress response protein [Oscillospiraceae bacterium OttesenSCG-928-F05]|nr:Asp23/Gls24 family envelope stress response protein [Oscillospiraceae bacterium OttesenSCG-928-F05]